MILVVTVDGDAPGLTRLRTSDTEYAQLPAVTIGKQIDNSSAKRPGGVRPVAGAVSESGWRTARSATRRAETTTADSPDLKQARAAIAPVPASQAGVDTREMQTTRKVCNVAGAHMPRWLGPDGAA